MNRLLRNVHIHILPRSAHHHTLRRVDLLRRNMSTNSDRSVQLVMTPQELYPLWGNSDAVPIDVSWFMPNVARNADEEFLKKRIPGARRMDLDVVASKHPLGLAHMIPTAAVFADACESIGVTPATHVVFYDSTGVFSSPRALFMFKAFGHLKASILNGGLPRWEAEGKPIQSGEFIPWDFERTEYPKPTLNEKFIRNYEQIVENAKSYTAQTELVLDARANGRFTGKDPEPRPSLPSGHIPHSKSVPFADLVESRPEGYTALRPVAELQDVFEKRLGGELGPVLKHERDVVNSCGSGMTAAVIWLSLQQLGVASALYDESWTGYASRPESKIEKGP